MIIDSPSPRPLDTAKRQVRAQRILDTAAALILRWGYNKTTIDDIAREAGVAKGTIYLHWQTREALFAALLRREKLALTADLRQCIATDPGSAMLHAFFRQTALALIRRPLLKAVLLRDLEVIGKLAHSERSSANAVQRLTDFQSYLEFLRAQGLVRSDLSLATQIYMLSAIFMGFFLVSPLMPNEAPLADEALADLIAETVRCTLESGRALSAEEIQTVSETLQQHLDRYLALAEEQL